MLSNHADFDGGAFNDGTVPSCRSEGIDMKRKIMTTVTAVLVMGSVLAPVSEANALTCSGGVCRGSCAIPQGAISAHRRVYAPHVNHRHRAYIRPWLC
jgi:hypothetical protein